MLSVTQNCKIEHETKLQKKKGLKIEKGLKYNNENMKVRNEIKKADIGLIQQLAPG